MNRNLFWCVISFIGGCFVGGYVVGGQCAKKHRRVVGELQDEVDRLVEEMAESDFRGLTEAHSGIVEPSNEDYECDGDIFDEEYEFDDPFDPRKKPTSIIVKDEKSGHTMEFKSLGSFMAWVDPDESFKQGELMTRILEGDADAYKELTSRYSSEKFDEIFCKHDHPRDSDEDEDEDDYAPDDIYLISPDTFRQELAYRDDETITYYQQDGVLINSADQLIDNQERCIGREALDEIGTTEEDYLYVDNQVENKIYEICVEHRYSYYRDVLNSGVGE